MNTFDTEWYNTLTQTDGFSSMSLYEVALLAWEEAVKRRTLAAANITRRAHVPVSVDGDHFSWWFDDQAHYSNSRLNLGIPRFNTFAGVAELAWKEANARMDGER